MVTLLMLCRYCQTFNDSRKKCGSAKSFCGRSLSVADLLRALGCCSRLQLRVSEEAKCEEGSPVCEDAKGEKVAGSVEVDSDGGCGPTSTFAAAWRKRARATSTVRTNRVKRART